LSSWRSYLHRSEKRRDIENMETNGRGKIHGGKKE
jgi:hypothetical protein